jgi:hypothetical protein
VDEKSEKVFCLMDSPDKEAAAQIRMEVHGLLAHEINEVSEGS